MRAKTHILKIAGIAVVAVGLMAGPASAATPPINGVGTGHCNLTGTIKFKPALKNNQTGPSKVSIKAKLSNCGGTGNTVTGGSTAGSENTTTSDCASIVGTMHNTLTTTAKWKVAKGHPKLNPSTIVFTTETGNASTPLSFDASGSVTAGSFLHDHAAAHAVIQETLAQIAAACGGKGLKLLHITSASTSTLS